MNKALLPLLPALALGCSSPPASRDPAPQSSAAWSAPSAGTTTPAPPASTTAAPAASSTAPAASASAPAPPPAASASAAPPGDAPVPKVKVANIGMHIGGGPDANSDENKAPIRESVAPHFDALRKCWGLMGDDKAKGDFGVDLLIPREGGKVKKVDNVRTTFKHAGFKACVLEVFEAIDFKKPRTGLTKVSYSLRFGG